MPAYEENIKEFLKSEEAKPYLNNEDSLAACLGNFFGRTWKAPLLPPVGELIDEVQRQQTQTNE